MKIIFTLLFFLHGTIHLMGFLKGYNLVSVPALQADISRTGSIFWLMAFLLFSLSGIAFLMGKTFWHIPAIMGVMVSILLTATVWSGAKFGLIPNLLILVVAIGSISSANLDQMIARETHQIMASPSTSAPKTITADQLVTLPAPVQRWLRKSGMIGKPRIQTGWVKQKARMKMKPEQEKWHKAEATQYFTTDPPAFIWTVDLKMSSLAHIKGRDKFTDGKGEMLIRLNSLLNVVNEKGPKMDEGTMQRFLGEMVWYPSAALSPYVTWDPLDDRSAKATMSYLGTSGSGVFYFNENGDFTRFSAMRFMGNEPGAKRHEWIIRVKDYATFDHIRVPSKMEALWKLEQGDWTWLQLEIEDLQFNIDRCHYFSSHWQIFPKFMKFAIRVFGCCQDQA